MNYISRSKLYSKVPANTSAKKIYVICEGNRREVQYFRYFEGLSSKVQIIPIPSEDGHTDPEKLLYLAESKFSAGDDTASVYTLDENYGDEVWFVIDTDRWNENNKIEKLRSYCAAHNRYYVAQSNPSFEIWLYYHLQQNKPDASEVTKYTSFKEYVGFVIKGGFDSKKMPVEPEAAIANSLANYTQEYGQPGLFATELHNLGNVILEFVKAQLDKAKRMMELG